MKLWRSIVRELRRLNSARIDRKDWSRLSHREKTMAVKAALKEHHQTTDRCC